VHKTTLPKSGDTRSAKATTCAVWLTTNRTNSTRMTPAATRAKEINEPAIAPYPLGLACLALRKARTFAVRTGATNSLRDIALAVSRVTGWASVALHAIIQAAAFTFSLREFPAPWRRRPMKLPRDEYHGRKGDHAVIERLTPAQVRAVQDPAELPCRLSHEMPPLAGIIGQDRAMRALSFGLGIQQAGYHIYVSGLPGTGKTTAVLSYLAEVARTRPPASDWCYVHNPKDSYRPLALELPAGRGPELARDVENMVRGAAREIRAAFESDEYAARREQITSALQRGRAELLRQLETRAN